MRYFPEIEKIKYNPSAGNDLFSMHYRYYDKNKVIMGKTMEAHLRPSVCFWHSFCWEGQDGFGNTVFEQSWLKQSDPIKRAQAKIDAGLEFTTKLDLPFFTFHDRDILPEADTFSKTEVQFKGLIEYLSEKMHDSQRKLLWGTANLTSHPRYRAGAATNPDPNVFMAAVAQVKLMLESTHQLGGENYVLWGGREGYDTLLNTHLSQEMDQLGRFLSLIVDYKHKIGYKGTLLIEPKPCEPCKHQYDFDVAHVLAFLRKYDLEKEFKVNIEANHATLAGHSFSHEVAYAISQNIFGSIDANRGDPQLGWDTDQFPLDLHESTIVMYHILKSGGFASGGFNFDSKLRRQSSHPKDLFYGHIAGMDTLARALLAAERLMKEDKIGDFIQQRYQGWETERGQKLLSGQYDMESIAMMAMNLEQNDKLSSGHQECLEHYINNAIK